MRPPTTVSGQDALVDDVLRAFGRVHARLGPGFVAAVYRQALVVELRACTLPVVEQPALPVFYLGQAVGEAVADMVVDGTLVVAVEAARFVTAEQAARLDALVRATGRPGGLLVNFGHVAEHWPTHPSQWPAPGDPPS